jgi:hypothetical protein
MRGNRIGLAALLALAACNGSPANKGSETHVAVATTTMRPAIAWPATSAIDDRALAAIGSPEKIARSPVPVLVPGDVRLESPTLVVEGEFYSLAGWLDGAKITIQGTRAAHKHEDLPPFEPTHDLGRAKGFLSVNEGIRTASWLENGAAYTVDVECKEPDDKRCTSEGFVRSLVLRLAFVGGAGK